MYVKLPFELSFQDYPEPDKWAIIIYFQGCNRYCPDCHNSDLRNYHEGVYLTHIQLNSLIEEYCSKWHTNYLVFSGGDPLMSWQLQGLYSFINFFGDLYNICIYTGADKNEIISKMGGGHLRKQSYVKYYKGGAYKKEFKLNKHIGKTDKQFQLATSNQFFLDSNFNLLSNYGTMIFP